MIRALNTGVLGMRQFQTSLDVIGNNLANINTVAYKGARVEFQDTLSQTLRAPTPDTATTSGAAGMQVGNGMAVSAIKNTFTQGAMKNTGVRTDMSVNGKGFFLVKDPTTNELFATRAGDFREDKNGYLVTNDGFRVQGKNKLAPAYTTAQQTEIGDLRLDVGQYTADRTGVSLDYSTNVLTKTAHGFSTGNQIKFPSTLPAIANETNTTDKVFFVNKASDDTFTVHSTAAEAATGANAVNFTDATISAKTGFATDVANDKITLASHGLSTGNTVYVKEGTIPGGLTAGNSYFISVSGDDIHFHTTSADATAGANKVDLTSAGSSDFKLYVIRYPENLVAYGKMIDGVIHFGVREVTPAVEGARATHLEIEIAVLDQKLMKEVEYGLGQALEGETDSFKYQRRMELILENLDRVYFFRQLVHLN